jgi:hypothetical protein
MLMIDSMTDKFIFAALRIRMHGIHLTENPRPMRGMHDGVLGAVSAGFFFLLLGLLFFTIPELFARTIDFIAHFTTTQVPHTSIYLPYPQASQPAQSTVYSAAEQFGLIWAVFLLAILVARIIMRVPLRRQADNLGDVVFWFGTAYLIQTFLIETPLRWFEFWAGIIIFIGLSLIVRAIYLAVLRKTVF